jgi:hypothetical protein
MPRGGEAHAKGVVSSCGEPRNFSDYVMEAVSNHNGPALQFSQGLSKHCHISFLYELK